jgi:hypothetical protein
MRLAQVGQGSSYWLRGSTTIIPGRVRVLISPSGNATHARYLRSAGETDEIEIKKPLCRNR